MTLSVGIGTGGASAIVELEILLGAAGLSLTGMNVYGSIRGIMVANEMKEASTTMHEAKLQNNYLKQVMETLDYVLKTYIPSEACVNLMEAIKYTSRFEEHKRDLEFKEERKDADVMVARKYLYDRKYKLDSVILNEFSREHGKEVDIAIVHLGMYADEYTRSLNALAITIGMDIFFRNGAYRPETEEGRRMRGAAAGRASGGGGETGEIVGPLPEEVRRAQMNANYEHDKAALAKEDPLFAKNRFWDVGHAEGSGETERSSYNNMLNKAKEETCAKIEEKEWQV